MTFLPSSLFNRLSLAIYNLRFLAIYRKIVSNSGKDIFSNLLQNRKQFKRFIVICTCDPFTTLASNIYNKTK